jgi:site-specific DNA-methyltransferase (adenine-specific)
MKELGHTEIDAKLFPSNVTNIQEIALHENLRRNNLQWYEQVELEKELHDLRIQEHGEKRLGRDWGSNPGWTKEMTAKELGLSIGGFSQDMKLATALLVNPELRNIKDKTTALRLLRNIENRQWEEISARQEPTDEMDNVLHGDSSTLLKYFSDNSFDVCITDPPWSEYKDEGVDQKTLLPIFREIRRVLKPSSFLYVFTSTTDWYFYYSELQSLGFSVQKYPLHWHKTGTITHGRRVWEYARDFEPILLAVKGSPTLSSGTEKSSILKFESVHYNLKIHPHEKPIELITSILQDCSYPGSKVLDPFAGSGVVGIACKKTNRRYVLMEKEIRRFKLIEERLR